MIHQITLGDWSGDGHGISEDYYFDIPDRFTPEILSNNYRKNVAELGVDPEHIAEDYEDSSISPEAVESLREAGFTGDIDEWDGQYSLWAESYLEIVMFLYGHGLEDFSYKRHNPATNKLLGSAFHGYGLFGN